MAETAALTCHVWSDLTARPGWAQMSIDQSLLERADHDGLAMLRLYRWSADTISFGANEAAARHWNRAAIEAANVPCVRRPSGGRAVWHARTDLTYALTAPLDMFGSLREAYREIHARLAEALARLALPTSLAPPGATPGLGPGACFDVAVGGEVMVGRRKAIGSAQHVLRHGFLQHGAIARASHTAALARFRLGIPGPEARATEAPMAVAEDLARSIELTWHGAGAETASADLVDWAETAMMSHADRFQDPAWTWRR